MMEPAYSEPRAGGTHGAVPPPRRDDTLAVSRPFERSTVRPWVPFVLSARLDHPFSTSRRWMIVDSASEDGTRPSAQSAGWTDSPPRRRRSCGTGVRDRANRCGPHALRRLSRSGRVLVPAALRARRPTCRSIKGSSRLVVVLETTGGTEEPMLEQPDCSARYGSFDYGWRSGLVHRAGTHRASLFHHLVFRRTDGDVAHAEASRDGEERAAARTRSRASKRTFLMSRSSRAHDGGYYDSRDRRWTALSTGTAVIAGGHRIDVTALSATPR